MQGTTGLPIFVGAMAFAVKAVIDKVARDGGLESRRHVPLQRSIRRRHAPQRLSTGAARVRDGALFCWLASVGHWLDIGGNVPGRFNARATESFQEGVRIPPVKLISAGRLNPDIIAILDANSRVPQSNHGDLIGQLNALDLGERRLTRCSTITARRSSRRPSRLHAPRRGADARNIAALPDGRYRFEDYLDNDGVIDERLTIALDLTIAGEEMTLDFSRTSPPCAGPLNIARSTAVACCYVASNSLHRCARQRRLSRADPFRHPGDDAARR